jgi:hypothetical protein
MTIVVMLRGRHDEHVGMMDADVMKCNMNRRLRLSSNLMTQNIEYILLQDSYIQ